DILYDRKKSVATTIVAVLLLPLSLLFAQVVRLRRWLYCKRILASDVLGCPVIVVGNLTVGGTGKTPVVEKIARELHERGRKVAILSRGYKSKSESKWKMWIRSMTHKKEPPPKIVSDGKTLLLGSEVAGDEPFMLAKNLPGIAVLVDKDRVKAGRYAIKNFGVDTLILDDGFQYFPLLGYVNLLLIDKTNPFGNRHLIPRGILREPVSQIKRASYVLLTKADTASDDSIIETIMSHKPGVKIIQCAHFPRNLSSLDSKEVRPTDLLNGKKIMAFSGIASPDGFENFLSRNGAEIVYKKRFVDHHRFSRAELENIFSVALAKGAEFAVTTEKDAVRMPKDFEMEIPTFFLKMDIEIISGEEIFEEAISKFNFNEAVRSTGFQ
ncbi:MAG: tetraacyldisaccharide 4'-kinase, partial [Puniceicoccales bacterium]|nr:tetraacyldisaccharide 4'-kinase [Puniceicoccales bacterium]